MKTGNRIYACHPLLWIKIAVTEPVKKPDKDKRRIENDER